ncbi:hypothetical protein MVEN_01386900 [Mycena venus]|uniref:DUF6535 domain-containing protein n=1 Tax=Mycena venus TaxID=2733690 RepID=A0A8H6XYF6_9AGAR|nr:hypothetical protein MVEN_01386900 [Mycena venus]
MEDDGPSLLPEHDRLIKVLQTCFSDLVKNQQDQARRQDEQAEKLQQAVEALKPKIPVTDRKTAFWNAYKTLADEHDEEFQRKYSTDLDTALIFAGLFSAVDSAFIIQIQQEIHPRGTPLVVLIAQNLLYISLFSTLLAALLAVLGKQWLMYYQAAGEHGTIEARGLERQRKFDGLRRWKFDAVMQVFPLLLQIGLFLFSAALSTYLWRTHVSLAITVLSLTSVGFISYMALLISAIAAPDSPFQTPLAPLIAQLIPVTPWRKLKEFYNRALSPSLHFIHHLSSACSLYIARSKNVLPLFLTAESPKEKYSPTLDEPAPIFDAPFPEPSPEVPAVSWVLEASTDPHTIDVAAKMVIHLQWPGTMDATLQLNRLRDSLLACFDVWYFDKTPFLHKLLDGMTLQAIHLGQAYCALRWALQSPDAKQEGFNYAFDLLNNASPELVNVIQNLIEEPVLLSGTVNEPVTRWGLRVIPSIFYPDSTSRIRNLEHFLAQFDNEIPSLDVQSFTDYLFCIHSFLSAISPLDIAWMDKSQFQGKLFDHILLTLLASLQTSKISMDIIAKVIDTTNRLANKDDFPFPGWRDSGDPSWIYETLECVQTLMDKHEWVNMNADRVGGLFNALLHHGAPPARKHVHLLLHALSLPGLISRYAAQLFVQNNVRDWFLDEELQPILQKGSLWASIMRISSRNFFLRDHFIALGHTLASVPTWKPFIHEKLSSWIMLSFYHPLSRESLIGVEKYNSVLSQLWNPDTGKYEFINDSEKALGLSFVALSKLWTEINFDSSGSPWGDVFENLRCTGCTVLRVHYAIPITMTKMDGEPQHISAEITPQFIKAFSHPLHGSLIRAAAAIKALAVRANNPSDLQEIFPYKPEVLESITKIIEELGNKMPHSVTDLEQQPESWDKLREQFNEEIDMLEKSLLC